MAGQQAHQEGLELKILCDVATSALERPVQIGVSFAFNERFYSRFSLSSEDTDSCTLVPGCSRQLNHAGLCNFVAPSKTRFCGNTICKTSKEACTKQRKENPRFKVGSFVQAHWVDPEDSSRAGWFDARIVHLTKKRLHARGKESTFAFVHYKDHDTDQCLPMSRIRVGDSKWEFDACNEVCVTCDMIKSYKMM